MKSNKTPAKKLNKVERERDVLFGLVDYYLKTGKPVGSNSLKEEGFENLSSATIRNYFAKLEDEGYLAQQHISGGRIPTDRAFRAYAHEYLESDCELPTLFEQPFYDLKNRETREIAAFLHQSAEILSRLTETAVFMSAPRFDHDIITSLRLMPIDRMRCLAVLITDFGLVQTEILQTDYKLSSFAVKRIEAYFNWRLTGHDKPDHLNNEEEQLSQNFYNELMMRYIVGHANFSEEKIYQTGFSTLLGYAEFRDSAALASSLALFENSQSMRLLLAECTKLNGLKFWIGDDLKPFTQESPLCAVVTHPYYINSQPVGAVGVMAPLRIPYRQMFKVLRTFSDCISSALTRNIYKFKISFRQPQKGILSLLGSSPLMLIEDKGALYDK